MAQTIDRTAAAFRAVADLAGHSASGESAPGQGAITPVARGRGGAGVTRRRWNEGQRKPGEEWPLSRHDSFTKWTAATSATEEAALVMAARLIDAYFTAALQGRRGDNQVAGSRSFCRPPPVEPRSAHAQKPFAARRGGWATAPASSADSAAAGLSAPPPPVPLHARVRPR